MMHAHRISERYPVWIPSPDDFWELPDWRKLQLMTYNNIRISEEYEIGGKI